MSFLQRSTISQFSLLLLGILLLVGCGKTYNAAQLLQAAKTKIDSTSTLHFQLTSGNLPSSGSGLLLTGGEGDVRRPDQFTGHLQITYQGLPLSISVVSVNGGFWESDLTHSGFEKVDPSTYGVSDPGQFLSSNSGASSILDACASPQLGSPVRVNGEELQQISCTVPGAKVNAVLPLADATQSISVTLGINADTNELRTVDLSGPFFSKGQNSKYHLVLTEYGQSVNITPPA